MGIISIFRLVGHISFTDHLHVTKHDAPSTPVFPPASDTKTFSLITRDTLRVHRTRRATVANILVSKNGGREPVTSNGCLKVQIGIQISQETIIQLKLHCCPILARLWSLSLQSR